MEFKIIADQKKNDFIFLGCKVEREFMERIEKFCVANHVSKSSFLRQLVDNHLSLEGF